MACSIWHLLILIVEFPVILTDPTGSCGHEAYFCSGFFLLSVYPLTWMSFGIGDVVGGSTYMLSVGFGSDEFIALALVPFK